MGRLVTYLFYTLAALLLLLIAASHLFHGTILRDPLQRYLSAQLHQNVVLGKVEYRLLHPYTLLLEDVELGSAQHPLFKAKSVYIELDDISWFAKHLSVQQLTLIKPEWLNDTFKLQHALPAWSQDWRITAHSFDVSDGSWQGSDWLLSGVTLSLRDLKPQPKFSNWLFEGDFNATTLTCELGVVHDIQVKLRQSMGEVAIKQMSLGYRQGLLLGSGHYNYQSQALRLDSLSSEGMRIDLGSDTSLQWPQWSWLSRLDVASLNISDLNFSSYRAEFPLTINQGWFNSGLLHLRDDGQWLDWRQQHSHFEMGATEAAWRQYASETVKIDGVLRRDELRAELSGKAFKGHYQFDFAIKSDHLTLKQVNLDSMAIPLPEGWVEDFVQTFRYASKTQLTVDKLKFNQLRLLSYDNRYPLSMRGLSLQANDLNVTPNSAIGFTTIGNGLSHLHGQWQELVYDGIWSTQGQIDSKLSAEQLTLNSLVLGLPKGQLQASGKVDLNQSGLPANIKISGEGLDLGQLSVLGHQFAALEGQAGLRAQLSADIASRDAVAKSISGSVEFKSEPLYLQRLDLDRRYQNLIKGQDLHLSELRSALYGPEILHADTPFASVLPNFSLLLKMNAGMVDVDANLSTIEQPAQLVGRVDLSAGRYQTMSWRLFSEQGCKQAELILDGAFETATFQRNKQTFDCDRKTDDGS